MLRAFKKAKIYVRFQNYVFGLSHDTNCIINMKTEREDEMYDQFIVGNYKIMWTMMLSHPLIKKQYEGTNDKVDDCHLIIEVFDHSTKLLKELNIEIKDHQWYQLDDEFHKEAHIQEIDIMEWLYKDLPKEIVTQLKGEIENESIK